PAHGARRHRRIATQLELAAEQALHALLVHEEHHQIRGAYPDLEAEAPAAEVEVGRSAPTLRGAATRHAPPAPAADHEGSLDDRWKHGHALRIVQDVRGDGFVWSRHDLRERFSCLRQLLDFVLDVRCLLLGEGGIRESEKQQSSNPSNHGTQTAPPCQTWATCVSRTLDLP